MSTIWLVDPRAIDGGKSRRDLQKSQTSMGLRDIHPRGEITTDSQPFVPTVGGWRRPGTTFKELLDYLKKKDPDLWLPIIDYWIGQLFLLRSNVEAEKVRSELRKKEESAT